PASAARRVLRRCANAASTTAKTCSRDADVRGGRLRVNATSPESTLGCGQNTPRPTRPACRVSAYQAILTLGTPYALPPGGAASRSATSSCTITRPRSRSGNSRSVCSSTGTATLYGRLATRTRGSAGSPSVSEGPADADASRSADESCPAEGPERGSLSCVSAGACTVPGACVSAGAALLSASRT